MACGEAPRPRTDGVFVYSPNRPDAIISLATSERTVALTFDDGPDPLITPRILDLLERYGAHATFFVLGRHARENPGLLVATLSRGNEIANHTYDHATADQITPQRLAAEIRKTSSAIEAAHARESPFFRPPKGLFDERSAETVRRLGYRTVGWTFTLERFVREHGVSGGVNALLARLRPGGIVLAHDGRGDKVVIEALPLLLRRLEAAGYRVVTVGQLFATRMKPGDSAPAG